jgi:rhodanese-related sulfurtransferase
MRWQVNHWLAALALTLAGSALIAGQPEQPRSAEADRPSVDAVQLATWIRDRRPGLSVLDFRSREEFDQYHIPNAEHGASSGEKSGTIVVYLDDRPYTLRGGLDAWLADIMSPRLPANASPAQIQKYERQRSLAEYFGGQAERYGDPEPRKENRIPRRRTC